MERMAQIAEPPAMSPEEVAEEIPRGPSRWLKGSDPVPGLPAKAGEDDRN